LKKLFLFRDREHVEFAHGNFLVSVILQTAVWMVGNFFLWRWLRPDIAEAQITSTFWAVLGCFTILHAFMGLFEYFFHRYVLHSVFWRPLGPMKRKHTEHHSLTHVRELKHKQDDEGNVEVRNCYPIVTPEQIESSAFPGYALVSFLLVFSGPLIAVQLLLPGLPILLAGYLAVVFSYALYEVKHAVEHNDYYSFWKPRIERSRFFRSWYAFHLMHHSRIRVNQAIGGVFALPIWDWVFGTYFIPEHLPLPEATVPPESQVPPEPRRIIRWLDSLVAKAEDRIVARRKKAALRAASER